MMLSDVCLSIAYIWPKSRTERPRKTKIGTEVAHVICDLDTTFKVKRSRSQVEEAYCGGLLPTACFRQVIMLCPVHSLLSACYECCQPKMIGTCSVPLKFILQADALFLDRTLEVRDRPRAAGHNSSLMQDNDWPLVGLLKVRLEPSWRMSSLFYNLVHGKQEIIKTFEVNLCEPAPETYNLYPALGINVTVSFIPVPCNHFPPFTTIHSITRFYVQILHILVHNLFPCFPGPCCVSRVLKVKFKVIWHIVCSL